MVAWLAPYQCSYKGRQQKGSGWAMVAINRRIKIIRKISINLGTHQTGLSPPVFLLTIPMRCFCCGSNLFVIIFIMFACCITYGPFEGSLYCPLHCILFCPLWHLTSIAAHSAFRKTKCLFLCFISVPFIHYACNISKARWCARKTGLSPQYLILPIPSQYFCCGSLLLLILSVRIYTLVLLLCEWHI